MNEIQSVKLQGESYMLTMIDGTVFNSVPKVGGNKEYELIKQWLSEGNTPEPEFTKEELKLQKEAQDKADALEFLNKTDFKMIPDYFATLTKAQQTKLTKERAEARKLLK